MSRLPIFILIMLVGLAMMTLAGCEKVTSDIAGTPYVIEKEVSCTHAGICYRCTMRTNSRGELTNDCGIGFSMSCDGKQSAEVRITPHTRTWEKGSTDTYNVEEIVKRTGQCG
jgi:hypothetical protein